MALVCGVEFVYVQIFCLTTEIMEFISFNCNKLIGEQRRALLEELVVAQQPFGVFLQDIRVDSDTAINPDSFASSRDRLLDLICVDGYKVITNSVLQKFPCDRNRTAVLLPSSINYHPIRIEEISRSCFATLVETNINGERALLGSIYLLPGCDKGIMDYFIELLTTQYIQKYKIVVIGGDFNGDLKRSYTPNDQTIKDLNDCNHLGLQLLSPPVPTMKTSLYTIDHFIVKDVGLKLPATRSVEARNERFSDHLSIKLSFRGECSVNATVLPLNTATIRALEFGDDQSLFRDFVS